MQHGQFISDRWTVHIIRDICKEMGIEFRTYSDNWVLELIKHKKRSLIAGYKFPLNNSVASAVSADKVASYLLLDAYGIPAVEHRLILTKSFYKKNWADGLKELVVKPLEGTSGYGVARFNTADEANQHIKEHSSVVAWAVAPYEQIESERRFVLLDGQLLCQFEKLPVEINNLLMYNLGLGAKAVHSETTSEEEKLAKEAVKALGLRLAAVDVIKTPTGFRILEVNSGFMMENYMRQSDTNKQEAIEVYTAIIKALFT